MKEIQETSKKLNNKQFLAAQLIAQGERQKNVAQKIKVSQETISIWKQNKEFEGKSRAVQYLVDENISQANIKQGCEKIKFIDSTIKDAYLEKFKIYCLIFNDKKSEAQLLLDLLREQKQSSKFYDDKINFLLGVSEKTGNKINEKNLLNFYLSSITIADFKYEPTKKTKPEIWKYLNAANLIKLEDASNKEKLKELELAANDDQLDKKKISTGILPIAIRWHYAGYWKHIWKEDKKFSNYLKIDYVEIYSKNN